MAIDAHWRGHTMAKFPASRTRAVQGGLAFLRRLMPSTSGTECSRLADAVTRCRRFFPGQRVCAARPGLLWARSHRCATRMTLLQGGCTMRCISLTMGTVISAAALLAAGPLYAQSANDWAMPAGDYANT